MLQAELQKEREAKENMLAQLQLAAERELENSDLLQQLNTLQVCSHRLMQILAVFTTRVFSPVLARLIIHLLITWCSSETCQAIICLLLHAIVDAHDQLVLTQ